MEDLISREVAAQMLREKAKGYFVSMFATSSECSIARVVATECAAELNSIPAVDAVPVVRCGECIHSSRSPFGHPVLRWCPLRDSHRSPDWFCADGRRAGDA